LRSDNHQNIFPFSDFARIDPSRKIPKGKKVKFVSMENVEAGRKFVTRFSFREFKGGSKFCNGDTIMARITPSLEHGKTAFIDFLDKGEVGGGSTEFIVLSNREGVSLSEYVYYLAISSIIREPAIKSMSGTSGRQRVDPDIFKQIQVPVPSVSEQQSIAKILSDLDEKIELNNEMNKTLEEIAQAIFKSWFIDFEFPNENGDPYKSSGGEMVESELGMIPKGWDIGIFSDLCVLTMGLSPKGAFYNSSNEGYPLLNGATDFQNGVISPTKYTSKSTRLCKRGELLICVRGTIGNLTYADKEYCLGRGVASVSVKEEIFREYIFFKLKEKINHLISQASGSVILGLSKPDIENIRIIVPPKNIVSDYHKISFDIFLEKSLVTEENTKLSKIRDLLLPKLMTGKIRVPLED